MGNAHLNTRFTKSKKSGSHLDPTGEGGAGRKGPQTSARGGKISDGYFTKTSSRGSKEHTTPVSRDVAGPKTAERGGHNRVGHDRTNPTAGKAKSGSHMDQHPGVRKGTSKG